jgi:primase-like protein
MTHRDGVFATWQAAYAAHGIVTVPCSPDKKPLVKQPQKFGPKASREIIRKFSDAPALGFYPGRRNRVTVLDVDTRDERVLRDALDRHGATPLIVRTASGKFHGYYRHNGEARKIRPWDGFEIDLIGAGLCIAPPSLGSKGRYEIIEGRLDDLEALPVMRGLDAALRDSPSPVAPIFSAEGFPKDRRTDAENAYGPIQEGRRNNALFRHCMREAHRCDTFDDLMDVARTWNENAMPPLGDAEVIKTARSAWSYTERDMNRFGKTGAFLSTTEVDQLVATPDALALAIFLKAHNLPDSLFMVANGLGGRLNLSRRRLQAARKRLEASHLERVRAPSEAGPALYRWKGPRQGGERRRRKCGS